MCTGKKKKNKEQEKIKEQEKVGVIRMPTIGDCELRSFLIIRAQLGSAVGIAGNREVVYERETNYLRRKL